MKKLFTLLVFSLVVRTCLGQTVPDIYRTTPIPATGGNTNNRTTIDANLYANKNLRIPRDSSFTLNNAKDSIGYIMFNTTSNRFGVYRGSSVWDTYIAAADTAAMLSRYLKTTNQGTIYQVWHGNSSGAGSFGFVNLATDVSNSLPQSQVADLSDSLSAKLNTSDSTANSGYVTHGFFNSHAPPVLGFASGLTLTDSVRLGGTLNPSNTSLILSPVSGGSHFGIFDNQNTTQISIYGGGGQNGAIQLTADTIGGLSTINSSLNISYNAWSLGTNEIGHGPTGLTYNIDVPNRLIIRDDIGNVGLVGFNYFGRNGGTNQYAQVGLLDSLATVKLNISDTVAMLAPYQRLITLGTTAQYFRGDLSLATFPTGLPPTGSAGGDLTGTYPNPTVNTINSITKSYYDPTSSIQTQLNGKIGLSAISATSPIFYNNTTGIISSQAATSGQNGYLTSTDWNTFNGKQSSGNYITALTGEATATGPGGVAITLTNSAVIGKVLTGYASGAGTVSATDNILQAIQKLNGNIAALSTAYFPLTGGNLNGGISITIPHSAVVTAPSGDTTAIGIGAGNQYNRPSDFLGFHGVVAIAESGGNKQASGVYGYAATGGKDNIAVNSGYDIAFLSGTTEHLRLLQNGILQYKGVDTTLYTDSSLVNKKWVINRIGGGGTVMSVTSANADIGVTATTTNPVLTLNSGTGANQIVKLDGSADLPTLNGSNLTALTAANISSGTAGISISGNAATVTTNANLTGDVTSSGNATTLATVNSNVGSFGSSTSIPSFTVNAKGLITAASGNAVIAPAGTLTGTTLASNVVNSSLTTVGTLTAGAIPYSLLSGTVPTWNQNTTGTANNITAYTINQNLGTGDSPTFANVTATAFHGLADNSTEWSGLGYAATPNIGTLSYLMGYNGSNINLQDASHIQTFLGLGSNAYTSTAFLPLTAGSGNPLSDGVYSAKVTGLITSEIKTGQSNQTAGLYFTNNTQKYLIGNSIGSPNDFNIYDVTNSVSRLSIAATTGDATFTGNLTIGNPGTIISNGTSPFTLTNPADAGNILLNAGTTSGYSSQINIAGHGSGTGIQFLTENVLRLTIADNGGAAFTGNLSAANLSGTNTGDQTTSSANSDISVAMGSGNPVLTFNRALANGVTATTQSPGDNSTKVATTAYGDAAITALKAASNTWSGATNNFTSSLVMSNILVLNNYTVATLPASPAVGSIAYVTDALAPTFGATVVAGGSTRIPVFFNGTQWVVF